MSFTNPSDPDFSPSAVGAPQPAPADPPAPSAEPEPVPAAPVDQPAAADDTPSSSGPAKGDLVTHTSVDDYTNAEVVKVGHVLVVEDEIITVAWADGGRASLHVDEFEVL